MTQQNPLGTYQNDYQPPQQGHGLFGGTGFLGLGASGQPTTPTGYNHLGGYNNDPNDPNQIENQEDARLAAMGAPTQATAMQGWQTNDQNQMQQWANQSQGMLQQQQQKAQAQFNGAPTDAQGALQQQQGAQNGALSSMAHAAGGGARGAAAASGNAVQTGQMNQGAQANQMVQQQLSDKYAAADQMQALANQQAGLAGNEFAFQGQQGAQNAAYQQGWQGTNDQAALWGNTLQANRQAADLGFQTQTDNRAEQQQEWQMNQDAQIMGATAKGFGTAISALGGGGGGGGGGG